MGLELRNHARAPGTCFFKLRQPLVEKCFTDHRPILAQFGRRRGQAMSGAIMDMEERLQRDLIWANPAMAALSTKPTNRAAPLRIHLSGLIVILLFAVALPLIWLAQRSGEELALKSAREQMRLLAARTAERYEEVFNDALTVVKLGTVTESLASSPPNALAFKADFLIQAL